MTTSQLTRLCIVRHGETAWNAEHRVQGQLDIPLNGVSVKLTGRLDLRGFFAVDEGVRPGLRDIHATVTIDSPAGADDIERLKATVDRHCPVLDILRNVTPVKTEYRLPSGSAKAAA